MTWIERKKAFIYSLSFSQVFSEVFWPENSAKTFETKSWLLILWHHISKTFFESIQAEMILMFLLLFAKILNMGFEKLLRLTDEPKSQINFKSCQKRKLDSNFIWIWGNEIVIDPTMSINIFIFLKGLETFFNLIYLHHPPLVFILLDLNLIDQY